MKILIISSKIFPSVGGVQSVVRDLGRSLNNNFEVRIITNFFRPQNVGFINALKYLREYFLKNIKGVIGIGYKIDGISVVETYFIFWGISYIRNILSLFLFPLTLFHYLFHIFLYRPDIINIHFADNSTIYAIISKLLFPHIKLVSSIHGSDITYFSVKSNLHASLVKRLISLSDRVVFVSNALRSKTEYVLKCDLKNSVVIYNSIAPELIKYVEYDDDSVRNNNELLFVGSFSMVKGFDILIENFIKLKKAFPDLTLRLAGDGELRSIIDRVEGIVDSGVVTDSKLLAVLYKKATCLIVPSRWESFGRVAAEGIAFGCPVLASNVGGLKEIITDGVNGYLFDLDGKSGEGMYNCIYRFLTDGKYLLQLKINKRRFEFTYEKFIKQYEEVFN